MSDEEIIEGIKNSKIEAQEALYLQNKEICLGVLNKMNNYNNETSEEIFHEAYMILYKLIENNLFELTGTIKAWLVQTCKYTQLARFKKERLERERRERWNRETEGNGSLGNEKKEESEAKDNLNWAAFMTMRESDSRCFKTLFLFYFAKKRWDEIAILLGYKNANHAKNEKYRCLEKLRRTT